MAGHCSGGVCSSSGGKDLSGGSCPSGSRSVEVCSAPIGSLSSDGSRVTVQACANFCIRESESSSLSGGVKSAIGRCTDAMPKGAISGAVGGAIYGAAAAGVGVIHGTVVGSFAGAMTACVDAVLTPEISRIEAEKREAEEQKLREAELIKMLQAGLG